MTTRIVTDANGRKHITNEPLLHPPQRTWLGLTDEDYKVLREGVVKQGKPIAWMIEQIEAKLKEKNCADH